jgi:hypothetical protein
MQDAGLHGGIQLPSRSIPTRQIAVEFLAGSA